MKIATWQRTSFDRSRKRLPYRLPYLRAQGDKLRMLLIKDAARDADEVEEEKQKTAGALPLK
jgi:hypothetical protein